MPQRHDTGPGESGRAVGKVSRATCKPCRWCDTTLVDWQLKCGNETVYACDKHVDQLEKVIRKRHPKKIPVLWARAV